MSSPQPRVCHQCGVKDPKPGHDCKALCSLWGGGPPYGYQGLPETLPGAFRPSSTAVRAKGTEERASRGDQLALQVDQQASQQAIQPHNQTSGGGPVTDPEPHPREGEEIQAPGKIRVPQPSPKPGERRETGELGLRCVSHCSTRPHTHPNKNTDSHPCPECSTFKAQLAQQQIIIASLEKRLAELESSRDDSHPDKRKRPSRIAGTNSNAMDTAPSVPPAQGECASFSPQAEVEG
ncbi:hypothetical protein HPB48_015643 [Haemaphysalis longicornis]|uniref:Uncharacterized protein n=1 Tax=Haemaphysalis longicornis TaxID=44386 RepID=A0A9J6GCB8_HAELO|nr:hypothetical protein HPB48_015643 [Haemaphysalis longicornis]